MKASLNKKVLLVSHPSKEDLSYFELIFPDKKQLFKISPFIPIFIYSSDQYEFIKNDNKKRYVDEKIIQELLISHISLIVKISKRNILFFNNFRGSTLEPIIKKINSIKKFFDPLFYIRLIL